MRCALLSFVMLIGALPFQPVEAGKARPRANFADPVISGIELCNPRSVEKKLEKPVAYVEDLSNPDGHLFHADFLNRDSTQVLTLVSHPGATDVDAEVVVRAASKKDRATYAPLADREFVSGRGVRLGMSTSELVGKFGGGKKDRHRDFLVVEYEADYPSNAYGRCDLPHYYGRYRFYKDKLVEFSFGFDAP